MKKKTIISLGIASLLGVSMLLPPVQSFAESALSIFRVKDAKTINITVGDIQGAMDYFKQFEDKFSENHQYLNEKNVESDVNDYSNEPKTLSNVNEFTAFNFNLPSALKDETPELYAYDSKTESTVLNTDEINALLTEMGITSLVDSSFNGTEIKVNTPPTIMAEYKDVSIFATQGINVDAPKNVKEGLKSTFLSMPFISENIRTQLNKVDVDSQEVYLPVIMGLGREAKVGNSTGYIYSMKDFKQVADSFPEMAGNLNDDNDENASILLWVNNGILYGVAGDKSDNELIEIARSIN